MVALPFGWPLDPDDISHKTDRIYGCYNRDWDTVNETVSNFHPGIDLLPPVGTTFPPVHAISGGEVTDIVSSTTGYVVVVEDDINPGYYWCYQHLNEPSFSVEYVLEINEAVGTMYDQSSSGYTHLHFQRTDYPIWDPSQQGWPGGIADPLNLLDPSNAGYWGFTELPGPSEHPWFYFLEDMPIDDWADWSSMGAAYADTLAADSLHGAVDIVKGFSVICTGEYGTNPEEPLLDMPTRISWDCIKLNNTGFEIVFSKYPIDFTGEFGSTDDWLKYKQFYFRYGWEFFDSAIASCITNCNDNSTWNGIDNIEENCWNTALSAEGGGESYNPLNMTTPDGVYFIRTTEYAWDSSIQQDGIECILNNNKEIAQQVRLSDAATDQDIWHAEWVATYPPEGFAPFKNIYTNTTLQPGSTMDIEIIYSGPMSTTVTSSVRFTKPDEPYLTATPSTPEWTSTNQPDGYFDTWHGTVDVPVEGYSGWLTMETKAKDISDIGLLDPSIADPDPPSGPGDDEYTDDHHGFGIAFSSEPGWPVLLSHWVNGSPALGDFDGDEDLDIAIQCNDGSVQLIDETGLILRTLPSGDWSGFSYPLCSSPAIADLDLDGDMEVIAVHPFGANAWHAESGLPVSGWPANMGNVSIPGIYPSRSAPAVCDLIGDEHPEVVICRHLDLTSPNSICTVWMFDYAGNYIWSRELEDGGVSVASTPAVGDISSIYPGNEILVCTSDGFISNYPYPPSDGGKAFNSAVYLLDPVDGENIWKSQIFNCYFYASPVIGDIDGDGINEVIVGSHVGSQWKKVFVLDGDYGTLEHTFSVNGTVPNSVAICDLNDDGILDIVAVDNTGYVYCWSGDDFSGGSQYDPLPGFPVELANNPVLTSPSIADIDGDFAVEIVVGTGDGELYAINGDGSICSGYPVTEPGLIEISGQPVIANLDNDDSLELMFADGSDSYAYCYDLGVNSFPAEMPWRQFQHDSWHTGCFEADNTIPAPPTNLQGEHTDGTVILTWDLSVNDFYSPEAEEPTDVVSYQIWRRFPPFTSLEVVGRVHAGVITYTDTYNPFMYPAVLYKLTSHDGTNESEFSNDVRLHTEALNVISLGCPVIEEFSPSRVLTGILLASEMQLTEESSHVEITSVHERTVETLPTATDHAVPSRGNPGCLTDGSTEVCYSPSPGADAVVIDLGDECTVTSILPERISDISPDVSSFTDESVRTLEAAPDVEPSLLIEVAGSDRIFYPYAADSPNSTETVRYIRIRGASGFAEISVYGSRGTMDTVSSVEITRSAENEGWMFAIPVAERGEEAEIKIYDVSGRMIWSGHAESGSVLHWDAFTANGTAVPNGVYLLQCCIGSDVSTGSFIVRRD